MTIAENVPLAELTTFKIGGAVGYVAECENEEDLKTALAYARERSLPWYVIGRGSNILASDKGYSGVVIRPIFEDLSFGSSLRVSPVSLSLERVWCGMRSCRKVFLAGCGALRISQEFPEVLVVRPCKTSAPTAPMFPILFCMSMHLIQYTSHRSIQKRRMRIWLSRKPF